jgi:hypothetical protein
MEHKHWNDDDLLERLLISGPEDTDSCVECLRRLEVLRRRRNRLVQADPAVPEPLLSTQRQRIYERLEKKPLLFPLPVAPSLAALLLLFVVLTVFRPTPAPRAVDAAAEDKLFQEVFTLIADPAPSSVEPVRSLFEVQQ